MTPRLSATPFPLPANEVLTVHNGKDLRVSCLCGTLWLTQSGDPEDIVLEAGQSFVLDRPGLAVISALNAPAILVIRAAGQAALRAPAGTAKPEGLRSAA